MQNIHNLNRVLGTAAFLAILCFGLPARREQSAQAQSSVANWPEKEYKEEKSVLVQLPNRSGILRAGEFVNPADQPLFDNYYNQSLFPNITHLGNRESAREDVVAKLRSDLRQCDGKGNQQVYNELTDLALNYLLKIAGSEDYHPAVRTNAMLAIGELNSPVAAKALLEMAFSRGQLFAVRVAAMSGLVRLAGPSGRRVLASDPDLEAKVLKSMVIVVKVKKGPGADGINWMRGQAADVLAGMGSTGDKNVVPEALLVMLSDKEMPVPLRSKAASALGKLSYNGNPPPAGPYVKALAEFADEALQSVEQILQSDNHAPCRGRVRQISHDVLQGMTPFGSSALASEVQKVLEKGLNKETEGSMTADELKTSVAKAKSAIEGALGSKG